MKGGIKEDEMKKKGGRKNNESKKKERCGKPKNSKYDIIKPKM